MLSIITVTRNDANGLRRTIDSTREIRSAWESIEQLVIDGSDEHQAADNMNFCNDQPKIRYFKREPRGISDAFNFGSSKAEYHWLWFLNGGDQINYNLDIGFFYAFLSNVNADILIFQHELMQQAKVVQFPPINKCFPPVMPWIPHPSTIISSKIVAAYGRFDEKYKIAMDYDFWIRAYSEKVVVNMVSIPIASYDENGLSSRQIKMVRSEGRDVLMKNKKKMFKLWLTMGLDILKRYKHFNKPVNGN